MSEISEIWSDDVVWEKIRETFPILTPAYEVSFLEPEEQLFTKTMRTIKQKNMTDIIEKLIFLRAEQHISAVIVPNFWWIFKNSSNQKYENFKSFHLAVNKLHNHWNQFLKLMSNLNVIRTYTNFSNPINGEINLVNAIKLSIRGTLLSQLPVNYGKLVQEFYETGFMLINHDEEKKCLACSNESNNCNCADVFLQTNRELLDMELFQPLISQILANIIFAHIQTHVVSTCKDNYDNNYLEPLEQWLNDSIIAWLNKVYGSSISEAGFDSDFQGKLKNYLFETFSRLRINQLFNIIIEYPESLPALEDLSICLAETDLRPLLTKKLQKAMETRLLHPGVSTPDILTAYVASIRAMRILDPSGLLLESVTQPVHQYLRSREDTIRSVVSSLTEEGPNDLAEELIKGEAVRINDSTLSDEENENWENWVPSPIEIEPNKFYSIRRSSDIISMLVNVYGSKELFVNEYRTLLADRLLSQFTCDTEKEIRYLELLKLRFGDSQLHYCEVMLKDIADSKRINQHIKQDPQYLENNYPMSAMIVSAQFWPPFKDENLQLHEKFLSQMEAYTRAFETLKGNRSLCWKNHLGFVDLEIELPDRTLNLSVSPVHATILMHFEDQNEWDLDDLCHVMKVPPTVLRKKIALWQSHGLIEEIRSDYYKLVEGDNNCSNANVGIIEDYESESAMASAQDQREEELQNLWSYVSGMLTNLDSLTLERIHQMLRMFAFQGPTIECSIQELSQFLDKKVREHRIVYSGGLYKLPKGDMT